VTKRVAPTLERRQYRQFAVASAEGRVLRMTSTAAAMKARMDFIDLNIINNLIITLKI
jgi:hypothetical protein